MREDCCCAIGGCEKEEAEDRRIMDVRRLTKPGAWLASRSAGCQQQQRNDGHEAACPAVQVAAKEQM